MKTHEIIAVSVKTDPDHGNELRVTVAKAPAGFGIDDALYGFHSVYLAEWGSGAMYIYPGREDMFNEELIVAQYIKYYEKVLSA